MIQQSPPSLSRFSSFDLNYLMEEISGKSDPVSKELFKAISEELDRRGVATRVQRD